jgi:hypothetical protein
MPILLFLAILIIIVGPIIFSAILLSFLTLHYYLSPYINRYKIRTTISKEEVLNILDYRDYKTNPEILNIFYNKHNIALSNNRFLHVLETLSITIKLIFIIHNLLVKKEVEHLFCPNNKPNKAKDSRRHSFRRL